MHVYPHRQANRFTFLERFTNSAKVQQNGGVLTGSPAVKNGVTLDGSTQRATHSLDSHAMARPSISIDILFIPDFAYDDAVAHFLLSSSSDDYAITKHSDDTLIITLGGTQIAAIAGGVYGGEWVVGKELRLIVSGTDGATDVWLGKTQILTADATAWTPTNPADLYTGSNAAGVNLFDGIIRSVAVSSDLRTQLDVDAIQNGSLFAYRNKAVVWYDMAESTARIDIPANELLIDGDMEAAGVGAWTAFGGAALTKETTDPYEGDQVLRITGGTSAYQSILAAGKKYRVIGRARSDGTSIPAMGDGVGTTNVFFGTNSTDWQLIDVVFTSGSTFMHHTRVGGSYVEFDAVSVREVLDQTLDKAKGGSVCLLGDGQGTGKPSFSDPGFPFDGVNDFFTLPADPTGTFTVVWKRRNEAVVFESDLTTWNLIGAAGGFAGLLDYLAWWPFTLSPIQKRDLAIALGVPA